jgi:hypothetical protein
MRKPRVCLARLATTIGEDGSERHDGQIAAR